MLWALSAPRSLLCGDVVNRASMRSRLLYYRGIFRSSCERDELPAFFAARGWSARAHLIGKAGVSYGRYLLDPIVDDSPLPKLLKRAQKPAPTWVELDPDKRRAQRDQRAATAELKAVAATTHSRIEHPMKPSLPDFLTPHPEPERDSSSRSPRVLESILFVAEWAD